ALRATGRPRPGVLRSGARAPGELRVVPHRPDAGPGGGQLARLRAPDHSLRLGHGRLPGEVHRRAGMQTYAAFDVLGNDRSTYVVVTADTTVQAYNEWGGYSLYLWRSPRGPGGHARKVSFDRPVAGWGDEQGLIYEIDGIRWIEREGYDVSYMG